MNPSPAKSRWIGVSILVAVLVAGVAVVALWGSSASGTAYQNSSRSEPAATTNPQTASSTIGLAANAKIGQNVLVDSNGMTLYLFVPDGTSKQSTVPAQFKPNWPPVTTTGQLSVGAGLDMMKVGSQTQADGTRQVTYNGHLLYTFIMDKAPGDANGQGLGPNNWFVLDANGNAIGAPATKATVSVAPNAKIGQPILVDASGMALYLFVPDGNGTKTTVPAQFKPNWPQLSASGAPVAGAGLDQAKIGVQTQTDGTRQVTYNRHLLYTFIMDKAPGDVNGQGLGPNNWFVLDANGTPIHSSAP